MAYDTSAYYAFAAPACLLAVALELWLGRRKGLPPLSLPRVLGNLTGGLGEVLVGLFLAPVLLGLYDLAYERFALIRWPEGAVIPWILAFVVGDLCYYWYHRAGHRFGGLWAIHGVHHQTEDFNFTVAMRHPWFSDTYSWPFYAPLPLMGIPRDLFFVAISAISFYALAVHTRAYRFPSFGVLVTPQTHIVHHARNPRYIGRNLGAMFSVWDRVFGTYAEVTPEEAPEVGPPGGYRSHDGARSQWIYFQDLLDLGKRFGWRTGLRALLSRPGWAPPDLVRPTTSPPPATLSPRVAAYAITWFVAATLLSLYVLWWREGHPWTFMAPASAAALWTLPGVGRVLDGRADAASFERKRRVGWVLLAVMISLVPGYLWVGVVMVGVVLIARSDPQ